MTTELIVRFLRDQPFEPVTFVTADGREFHAQHPEHVQLGRAGMTVVYLHPTGQVEVVDTALIVSIRTIYPASIASYSE